MGKGLNFGVMKCLGSRQRGWLNNIVHGLNTTELYILKELMVNFMLWQFYLNQKIIIRKKKFSGQITKDAVN